MLFRTPILLLLACLCTYGAIAQKPKKKPKSDVEIIDFGASDDQTKEDKVYHGLILKTSPTAFIFGRQPVELEKEISENYSIQAGIGVTFAPLANYDELLSEIRDEADGSSVSEQWYIDEPDYYNDYTIRKGKIGPQLSLSPRFFFESDGFEGAYIAPVMRYSVQHFEVQKVEEGLPYINRTPDDVQKESIKNFDLMVHYGNQTLYPKLTVEWFLGAGIRFRNNTRQDVGFDELQLAHNGEYQFKDKRLRLEVGVRVGFQL